MHENVFMIIFEVISYNYIHFPRVFKVQGKYLSELKKIKGSFSMVLLINLSNGAFSVGAF